MKNLDLQHDANKMTKSSGICSNSSFVVDIRSDTDSNFEICSICMESMNNKYTLPCAHSFHKKCVNEWKKYNKTCPNCRKIITNPFVNNNNNVFDNQYRLGRNNGSDHNEENKNTRCMGIYFVFVLISVCISLFLIIYLLNELI